MSARRVTRTFALLTLALLLGLAACGPGAEEDGPTRGFGTGPSPSVPSEPPPDGGTPPPTPLPLAGGVLFTVDCQGQIFHWWVTNPQTAQDLIDVSLGTKTVVSFGGWLVGGQGQDNHNAPWSWHVHPVNNGVDVLTVPESPKTPADCENHLAYWLSLGVTFIPVNGIVTAYQDFR